MDIDILVRKKIEGSGIITTEDNSLTIPGTIKLYQLFNGRILFEIDIDEKQKRFDQSSLEKINFSGTTNNGDPLYAKGLYIETIIFTPFKGSKSLNGNLYSPGYFEISTSENPAKFLGATIQVTNLPLTKFDKVETTISHDTITILKLDDYRNNRKLMSALETGGILAEINIICANQKTEEEIEKYIRDLCFLLSLSQRSYVWPTEYHLKDINGVIAKSHYEEPIFFYSKPSRPLIPIDYLATFINNSFVELDKKYHEWDLGESQDHYIQAMAISSAWSKSIGFFTALETLKSAFLQQDGRKDLEFYVTPNKFHTSKLFEKVSKDLCANHEIFKRLFGEKSTSQQLEDKSIEIENIRAKIKDINRRSYKSILNDMFLYLDIIVDEGDLEKLVRLRNQIIHGGSPNYKMKPSNTPDDAFELVCRFGGLVEKMFLAIHNYKDKFEPYDQSVISE